MDFTVKLMDKKDISKINYQDVLVSFGVGAVTKNMGILGVATTNVGVSGLQVIRDGNDPVYNASLSFGLSMAGYKIDGGIENKINPFFNPAKDKYKWIESNHLGVSFQPKPSTIPSTTGNVFNSLSSELFNNKLTEGKE